MEPTTVDGLPAHPLLAHFVVVLIPLAALALIVSVVSPAMRKRLGILTPLLALAAVAAIPLTAEAGEWLEEQGLETALVETHAELGEQLIFWSLPMLVVASVWWLLTVPQVARKFPSGRPMTTAVTAVIAVLAIGSATAATWEVYRVGHSGAESVWSGLITQSPPEND